VKAHHRENLFRRHQVGPQSGMHGEPVEERVQALGLKRGRRAVVGTTVGGQRFERRGARPVVVERIEGRMAALDRATDPRQAVEQVLHELLPLDDERRAENEVWLAFTARALIDPELRVQHNEVHDALHAPPG
jgi:hypothetical protein